MGFYADHVFPRLVEHTDTEPLRAERSRLLERASGTVLEIGLGTAASVPHYGSDVERVVAIEPAAGMIRRARKPIDSSPRDISIVRAGGEALPFADRTFDTVVAVLVLCTVGDVGETLAEVRRVLRPGTGRLLFLEHVIAESERSRRWQVRLEPLWKRLGCGCHLTRDTALSIRTAGFDVIEFDRFRLDGAPLFVGSMIRGVAERLD